MLFNAIKFSRYRFLLVVIPGLIIVALIAARLHSSNVSNASLLDNLWLNYKQTSWNVHTGQTTNHQAGQTTSEAQAYTMLRAVWQNDRQTFNLTWQWTVAHLQRPDKLFSWLWQPASPASSMTVSQNQSDLNTASDADSDIAMALLMAGGRWHDKSYVQQSQQIIRSIWQNEVVLINQKPYVAADNLEKASSTPYIVVNPSYFSPAAYRLFAQVDPRDNWLGLASNSYSFIDRVSSAPLDTGHSDGLPPDWVLVNRQSGALSPPTSSGQTTNFSYNAFRSLWRLGLDWQWFKTRESRQTLSSFGFLSNEWSAQHKLSASYSHDGRADADYSSLALYGGSLGYFAVIQPVQAEQIIHDQIAPLYDQQSSRLKEPIDYYDNNWLWFGLALQANRLPNLAKAVHS